MNKSFAMLALSSMIAACAAHRVHHAADRLSELLLLEYQPHARRLSARQVERRAARPAAVLLVIFLEVTHEHRIGRKAVAREPPRDGGAVDRGGKVAQLEVRPLKGGLTRV